MGKRVKRSLSLFLSLVLLITLMPVNFADYAYIGSEKAEHTLLTDDGTASGNIVDLSQFNGKISQEDYNLFLKYAKEYGITERKLQEILLKKTKKELELLKAKLQDPETHRKGVYQGGENATEEALKERGGKRLDRNEESRNHEPSGDSLSDGSTLDELKEFEDTFAPRSSQPKDNTKDLTGDAYEELGELQGLSGEGGSDFELYGVEHRFDIKKTAKQDAKDKMLYDMELLIEAKPQKNTDVVLVIDRSGSMREKDRMTEAQKAAKDFVDALIPKSGEGKVRVGLVTYATDATVNCDLTNDKDALKAAIGGIGIKGETFIQGGIYEARKMLQSSDLHEKIMIVISDGEPTRAYSIRKFDWVPSIAKPSERNKRYPDEIMSNLTDDAEKVPYVKQFGEQKVIESPSSDSAKHRVRYSQDNVPESYMDYNFAIPNLPQDYFKVADNENFWENPYIPVADNVDLVHVYNQTISEANIARTYKIDIYAIGIDLSATGQGIMTKIGGGKSYDSSAQLIQDHLQQIAGDLSYVAKDVLIEDPAGDVFELVGGNADGTIEQGAIRLVNKNGTDLPATITWDSATKTFRVNIDRINEKDSPIRVIYRLRVKDGTKPGKYKTNGKTVISYEDRDKKKQTQEFDVPEIYHDQAKYTVKHIYTDEFGAKQEKIETLVGTVGEMTKVEEDPAIINLGYEVESKKPVEITAEEDAVAIIEYKKRVVNFTAISGKELKYNGEVQTVEGFTSEPAGSYEGAQGGEAIKATGSARKVGSYDVKFTVKPAKVKDAEGKLYFAEYTDGTFRIVKGDSVGLGLTAGSQEKVYDGTEFKVPARVKDSETSNTIIKYKYKVPVGDWVDSGTTVPAIKDAGSIEIEATAENPNYGTASINYTVTVTKRPLSIQTASAEKFFDGKELTKTDGVTVLGLADGEEIDVNVTGTQTVPGKSDNLFTVDWKSAKESNYELVSEYGGLLVKDREPAEKFKITLESEGKIVPYNGKPQTAEGLKQTKFLIDSVEFRVEGVDPKVTATDPGKYENTIDTRNMKIVFGTNAEDVKEQFQITTKAGILEILKGSSDAIVLNLPKDLEKLYDGKPFAPAATAPDAVIKYKGPNDAAYGMNPPSFTDAGTYVVDVIAEKDGFEPKNAKYTVVIKKREVTLTSATKQKPFDGTPLTDHTVTVTGDGFADGEGADYIVTGTQLLPGTSDNSFTHTLNDGTKAENYKVEKTYGKLEVKSRTLYPDLKKLPLILKSKSAKLPYDATLLKVDGFEGTSFRVGDIDVQITGATAHGEGIEVGKYPNKIDASKMKVEYLGPGPSQDLTAEFEVSKVEGVLEITSKKKPSTDSTVTVITDEPSSGGSSSGSRVSTSEIDEGNTPLGKLNNVDHFAYIQGYPDGSVRPQGLLTREEVAAVFFRILDKEYREDIRSKTNEFTDMEPDRWSAKHVSTLAKGRIIRGYTDGTYQPSKSITRAELAAIASRFDKLEINAQHSFTDMNGHWAEKYVASAVKKGWVNGYGDSTFKPDKFVTRAEFVSFVNNVLNRHVKVEDILPEAQDFTDLRDSSSWYYTAMKAATNSYLFKDVKNSNNATKKYQKWTEIIHPTIEM